MLHGASCYTVIFLATYASKFKEYSWLPAANKTCPYFVIYTVFWGKTLLNSPRFQFGCPMLVLTILVKYLQNETMEITFMIQW